MAEYEMLRRHRLASRLAEMLWVDEPAISNYYMDIAVQYARKLWP